MIILDNKKAHDLGGQGLIDVNHLRRVNNDKFSIKF